MSKMVKTGVFVLLLLTVMVLPAMNVYSQEDMRAVDSSAFDCPIRPPAVFAHDDHNDTAGIDDCARCHHLFDDNGRKIEDESSEDQSCADCHAQEDKGTVPGLRKAFHWNCKGCHLQQRTGPVTCGECHVKK